ncbi:MAG: FeoB-associated Cys-rich membrane protein [Bacteroidales bacterium]|nr:FeoB-associated Cys-rich membrane protein [Bacteroidales bacterium]
MEKRDIIILVAVLAVAGLNLYRRYAKKKGGSGGFAAKKTGEKSSLSVQPDDYEPYSGERQEK